VARGLAPVGLRSSPKISHVPGFCECYALKRGQAPRHKPAPTGCVLLKLTQIDDA